MEVTERLCPPKAPRQMFQFRPSSYSSPLLGPRLPCQGLSSQPPPSERTSPTAPVRSPGQGTPCSPSGVPFGQPCTAHSASGGLGQGFPMTYPLPASHSCSHSPVTNPHVHNFQSSSSGDSHYPFMTTEEPTDETPITALLL